MSKIIIHENCLTADDFIYLYNSTGWSSFSYKQITLSLKNDLYHVLASLDNKVVGMGRLVGDGIIYWYIQNIIVLPNYQSQGIGTAIMENLLAYIQNNSLPDSHIIIGLMCSESTASFYKKFSFDIRPCKNLGPGATLEYNL